MNYVFFGTPRFAEIVLGELIKADLSPIAVVCNPDRPIGRKKIITPPPVKTLALAHGVAVFQPETLTGDFEKELTALAPDFFVVAAYAKIIPQSILAIARLGTIGTHPSLLPKYRGASPIQSVILAGEQTTGVSLYLMDAKMDHGPILAKEQLSVAEDETYPDLEARLAHCGGILLVRTIPEFFAGKIHPTEQDHTAATFTKKFKTEDGFVDEDALAAALHGKGDPAAIYRKILALNPEPGAWTLRDGKRLKLLEASIENGSLELLVTQTEGERPRPHRPW
jgi:methionyl-tRNA formyltransferase